MDKEAIFSGQFLAKFISLGHGSVLSRSYPLFVHLVGLGLSKSGGFLLIYDDEVRSPQWTTKENILLRNLFLTHVICENKPLSINHVLIHYKVSSSI